MRRREWSLAPWVGALLLLPALAFVSANILKYTLGAPTLYEALRPILEADSLILRRLFDLAVLLGPLAALASCLISTVRLRVSVDGRRELLIAVKLLWAHLLIGGLSAALLATMAAYLVGENLL